MNNNDFIEPWKGKWYYPAICEKCYKENDYIPNFAWINGEWFCSDCGRKI